MCNTDAHWMQQALELAQRGRGLVEPNPMVGCVLVRDGSLIAGGWHHRFGDCHAERDAISRASGPTAGATAFVTLEPCCHVGKTPPCTDALIRAGISRVVAADEDPAPAVQGKGFQQLRAAGMEITVGVLQQQARELIAPYRKRVIVKRPWVIAKWAMTLDGKIATSKQDSQWISNDASRQIVHELRGRVDAIMVGAETVRRDDPLLTARPAGPRTATRIVVSSSGQLDPACQLIQTAADIPTLIAVGPSTDETRVRQLRQAGCEIWQGATENQNQQLFDLLDELSRRGMTNVLVEGGSQLLGSLFDLNEIDECHVFVAPRLVGGQKALSAIGGKGVQRIADGLRLRSPWIRQVGPDVYVQGTLRYY